MNPVRRQSLIEQTVSHLRLGIREGRWKGALPGLVRLAKDLDVSRDTVREAVKILEAQGLILSHGHGRRREVSTEEIPERTSLRIGILTWNDLSAEIPSSQWILLQLAHDLEAAGHIPIFTPFSQVTLHENTTRIIAMMVATPVDAWVVMTGSQSLLDWLQQQPVPFLAVGGRLDGRNIASSSMSSAIALEKATKRLIELGHRRVVMVCRPDWIKPDPATLVRNFLAQLAAAGLPAGAYNTPMWEETPAGFQKLLKSIFRLTPPTALILPTGHHAFAAISFLSQRGLRVPQDVSLLVRSQDAAFDWVQPRIAHFRFDMAALVQRVTRWVDACAKGTEDRERTHVDAELVPGDTLAPPPRS